MSILPRRAQSPNPIPKTILGYLKARSETPITAGATLETAAPFRAPDTVEALLGVAESFELEVIGQSELGLAVSGAAESYEALTGGSMQMVERLMQASAGVSRYVTHIDIVGDGQPDALGCAHSEHEPVEVVVIDRPRILQGIFPSPVPPLTVKPHLRVPDDLAVITSATAAHRAGFTGDGVRVAMVDSGQAPHPFFTAHGYRVQPTVPIIPGTDPQIDPIGHGTGESANVFAIAPDCLLEPYRATDSAGHFVGAFGGFISAKNGQPQVMTNSWGGDMAFGAQPDEGDIALALETIDAVERGIVVVFSAGNGSFALEAQLPHVISAGGVHATPALDLAASNYSSGYPSPYFPGRTVPDLCGLVGNLPRAQYLMLPIPPNCEIDIESAQAAAGDTPDGTLPNDGWALFSGTSAAAPQIAGACAVLLQANPGLTPAQVKLALIDGAQDVHTGFSHPRFNRQAQPGHDDATGHGLLQVGPSIDALA